MSKQKLAITEDARVYRCNGTDRRFLGHLPYLVNEQTVSGRQVCAWWKAQVASDEPLEILVIRREKRRSPVRVPETALVVGSQPDRELAESAVTAD